MYQSVLSEFLKACEGTGKQGFLLLLSQIHSKDAYKKLYISIRVYHKYVEQTPRHSLITSSYLGQSSQVWSKCVNYVQNRYNSQQICNGYEYPSVSCVRYKEFQISLDEGTQEQN